jgi:tetratricopeptide (TPR) repeat protein
MPFSNHRVFRFTLLLIVLFSAASDAMIVTQNADTSGIGRIFHDAQTAFDAGRHQEALTYYNKAREILTGTHEYEMLVRTYLGSGSAFMEIGEKETAYKELQDGLSLANEFLERDNILSAAIILTMRSATQKELPRYTGFCTATRVR